MLRKIITISLPLFILIISLCSAMASEKTIPALDERQILSAIAEKVPLYAPALKNIKPENQAPFAGLPQSAAKLLDLLAEHDEEFSLILERVCEQRRISMSAQQYKKIIITYLQEMSAADTSDIAAGCLSPYAISAAALFAYTPTCFVLFLTEMLNANAECSLMYGSWTVTGVCFALSSWTTYRICAEENLDSPNQDTIAKLESDRETMQLAALVSLGLGTTFKLSCSDAPSLLDLGGPRNRK